ncbi:hypothetical protein B9T07_17775 [Limnospira fusiformis CCALA 023]
MKSLTPLSPSGRGGGVEAYSPFRNHLISFPGLSPTLGEGGRVRADAIDNDTRVTVNNLDDWELFNG